MVSGASLDPADDQHRQTAVGAMGHLRMRTYAVVRGGLVLVEIAAPLGCIADHVSIPEMN